MRTSRPSRPGSTASRTDGCELTEATPLAVTAEHATFAKPEISLGFPPPFGGSQRLPRHIGRKRGLEMILTGDPIPATRAADLGLVNSVVPADQLLTTAQDLAARIIRHAPTAVAACFATTVPTDGVRVGLRHFLDRSTASG